MMRRRASVAIDLGESEERVTPITSPDLRDKRTSLSILPDAALLQANLGQAAVRKLFSSNHFHRPRKLDPVGTLSAFASK